MKKSMLCLIALALTSLLFYENEIRIVNATSGFVPFFSQRDIGWNDKPLGESKLTIGDKGCGVTSAAMVLYYYGIQFNPDELSMALKESEGFAGALLRWGNELAWANATENKIKGTSVYWYYDEDVLRKNIVHDRPVIVYLNNAHYVVISGYDENTEQYYINDPWKNAESGKYIKFEDNSIGAGLSDITQMIILHTDQKLPVDGPLVDWPAIQEKYTSLGSMDGILGKPIEDDRSITDPVGSVKIRTQIFEGGKIYAYQVGSGEWRAIWLPAELAQIYDEQQGLLGPLGRLAFDPYQIYINSIPAGMRVDAQSGSLMWYSAGNIVDTYTKDGQVQGEYFNNPSLSGQSEVVRFDPYLMFDWGKYAPHPLISPDNFSVRYTQNIHIGIPGPRVFHVWANGGIRLYIDEDMIIDEWGNTASEKFRATKWLSRGNHSWVVEYSKLNNDAYVRAAYALPFIGIAWADDVIGSFSNLPETAPISSTNISVAPTGAFIIDEKSVSFIRTGSFDSWAVTTDGYESHFYWVSNTSQTQERTGKWLIQADSPGDYEVFVYIPTNHATTTSAVYEISHAGELDMLSVNQSAHTNEWVSLGIYEFNMLSEEYVQLSDATGEIMGETEVAFDAIGLVSKIPGGWEGFLDGIMSRIQNWWMNEAQPEIKDYFQGIWEKLIVSIGGGEKDRSLSPEETTRAYIEAIAAHDVDAVVRQIPPNQRITAKFVLTTAFKLVESFDIRVNTSALRYREGANDGTTSNVNVFGDVGITGSINQEPFDDTIFVEFTLSLQNQDGIWYMSGWEDIHELLRMLGFDEYVP